ncbi:MAG: sugar phosphate isomerase/epimerase family protein [Chitinophagaceae bacterium]
MQLTFGVSTWLWTSPFSSEQAATLFPKIKEIGFSTVEIAVEDPSLINPEVIKDVLRENNLDVVICGAFGTSRDLSNDDETIQKNGLQYIKDCLDIAQQSGASFFAGPMYSAVGKARMVSAEQRKTEWDRSVKNLQIACTMAAERGLQLAIEPLNRFESDMVNTAEDAVRLIQTIGHPAARIALDGFHMNIEEPDIEQAILTAGDKLLHLQVSENYRGTPGTGQTNWQALKNGMKKIKYKGVVSIESFTPENKELAGAVCIWKKLAKSQDMFAKEGLAFLKKLFDQ